MKHFKKATAFSLVLCFIIQALIILDGGLRVGAEAANSEYTLSYLSGGSWITFDAVAECSSITGIRIQSPAGKSYYLTYATQNAGNTAFYPFVSSNKSGAEDYAGDNSQIVQRIKIKVYDNAGISLDSKIVVMYRVKTAENGWLSWVSNANAEEMQKAQSKYSLGGTLDTTSSDAGIPGKNITALEIRIFEEETPVVTLPSVGSCETSPSLYYSVDGLNKIHFTQKAEGEMDCLWIETDKDKPYYLKYQVATEKWYSPVSSLNSSDYAGVQKNRITRIKIIACSSAGAELKCGVVVMYRVKTGGNWLPWVSNADPEWMTAIQIKYNLTGILDTSSGYAGIASSIIEGVEIRVFEENNLNPEITPTGKSKIISTPHFCQAEKYPTGCESVSAVTALNYFGVNLTVDTFIDRYLEKGDRNSFDPKLCFGGDPRSANGMGCYAPVIEAAAKKAAAGKKLSVSAVYGKSVDELCGLYIDNNIPVIFWATMDMQTPRKGKDITYNGTTFPWIAPEHCLLLVGYDDYNYIFRDPLKEDITVSYSKQSVNTAYLGMGAQAVVIEPSELAAPLASKSGSAPSLKPSASPKPYIKAENLIELNGIGYAEPYGGGFVMSLPVLSLFGEKNTELKAEYSSEQLCGGALGVGWHYNFEKRLELLDGVIRVYDSPSVYSDYVKSAENGDIYYCSSAGRSGYTVTVTEGEYLLNMNCASSEKYGSDGRLKLITDGDMFETEFTYSDGVITVTDRLTGKSLYLQIGADGLVSRVSDKVGREALLSYENGYLVSLIDPDGGILSFTYDQSGRLKTATDGTDALRFTNSYDAYGRLSSCLDGLPSPKSCYISYSDGGERTFTDRNGVISKYTYGENGQLVSFTNGNGETERYAYDESLNLIMTTDPLGNSETAEYNEFNKPIRKTDKNGVSTFYEYDGQGRLTSIIHPFKGDADSDGSLTVLDLVRLKKRSAGLNGLKNEYNGDLNYDGEINSLDLGKLKKALLENGKYGSSKESFSYDGYGRLSSHTDLSGETTEYFYNDDNLLVKKVCGEKAAYYAYDGGLLTSDTDYDGNITTLEYNAWGLISSKTEAGEKTEYGYNAAGNVIRLIKPTGEAEEYTYDSNGKMRSKKSANGDIIWYCYDENSNLSMTVMPQGKLYCEYDGEGRIVKASDSSGVVITEYDGAGRTVKQTDSLSKTESFKYDGAGRITENTDKNGNVTAYTYDKVGNPLTVTDSSGTVSYTYDAAGRIVKETDAAGNETFYEYNNAGELLKP